MCEGVFLFLQLFKLTTSNWFGHTVRVQRVHEVRGTSAWTNRSGAETHEVRGTSAWTDRSGAKTHEVRGTSAWTDRSGAETSNSTFTSSITG